MTDSNNENHNILTKSARDVLNLIAIRPTTYLCLADDAKLDRAVTHRVTKFLGDLKWEYEYMNGLITTWNFGIDSFSSIDKDDDTFFYNVTLWLAYVVQAANMHKLKNLTQAGTVVDPQVYEALLSSWENWQKTPYTQKTKAMTRVLETLKLVTDLLKNMPDFEIIDLNAELRHKDQLIRMLNKTIEKRNARSTRNLSADGRKKGGKNSALLTHKDHKFLLQKMECYYRECDRSSKTNAATNTLNRFKSEMTEAGIRKIPTARTFLRAINEST